MTAPGFGTKVVRGVELLADPAREACFTCVNLDSEMAEWPDMSDLSRRERLHRHMNNECGALEIAAQALADFPDAPWELRLRLARQAADEARHAAALLRRVQELGGHKGEFPVMNFEWGLTTLLTSLAGRLAVQNRTFEAGLIDLLGSLQLTWRNAGDSVTADLLDGILADEIVHVRFGNRWIRKLTEVDPRVLLQVAQAVRTLGHAIRALAPTEGDVNRAGFILGTKPPPAVNVQGRLEAEFTEEEVKEVLRQAGFRAILPHQLDGQA
jgi:uncharacterized ferritin-like protein (DUF455 family)